MTDLNCHSLYRFHKTMLTLNHTKHFAYIFHQIPEFCFRGILLETSDYDKYFFMLRKVESLFFFKLLCWGIYKSSYNISSILYLNSCNDFHSWLPIFVVRGVDIELAHALIFFPNNFLKFYFTSNKTFFFLGCSHLRLVVILQNISSLHENSIIFKNLHVIMNQPFHKNKEQS
jgi:hypothetical protein